MNLVSSVVADARGGAFSREERHYARLETSGRIIGGGRVGLTVHDLSPKGLLIEASGQLSAGDRLELDQLHLGLPYASVVWSSGPFHGCTFSEPITDELAREIVLSGRAQMAGADADDTATARSDGLGTQILKARQRHGLTTEEFAARLGVSRQAVWYWETGQRKPRGEQVNKMREVFGLTSGDGSHARDLTFAPATASDAADCIAACKSAIARSLGVDAASVRISIEY